MELIDASERHLFTPSPDSGKSLKAILWDSEIDRLWRSYQKTP
jgi:hypothetical protein